MTSRGPWHPGERSLHERFGVADRMAEIGPRVIRDFMPTPLIEFFESLPFLWLGSVDECGDPWAGLIRGRPGLARALDERTLFIRAWPDEDDPAASALRPGAALGLLGLEAHTRRRHRVNGRVEQVVTGRGPHASGLIVRVEHSFGNCPQYIHPRRWTLGTRASRRGPAVRTGSLTSHTGALIAAADTFVVASYVDLPTGRQVDVSHRGGPPGFVRIDEAGVLTIPDYAGNRFFNTLGNIALQPRVGLTVVDLARGEIVQVTGEAELLLDPDDPRVRVLPRAERAWTLRPRCVAVRPT